MSKIAYYSQEAYDNLKKDIDHLRNIERPRISEEIAQARDKGDLSENAEYDAAKEAQGLLEMKIAVLEEKLLYARIIDTSKLDSNKVLLYSKVKIKNINSGSILEYTLVSDTEADVASKKISANSPTVVYGCKEAIKFSRDHTTEEGLNWIKMWNSSMFNMTEIEEAFKAKFEKRLGSFSKLPKKVTKIK